MLKPLSRCVVQTYLRWCQVLSDWPILEILSLPQYWKFAFFPNVYDIYGKIGAMHQMLCQILRLKCTKFTFRWSFTPDPAGGAYSTPQTLYCIHYTVFCEAVKGWPSCGDLCVFKIAILHFWKSKVYHLVDHPRKPHSRTASHITSIGQPVAKLWPFCISSMADSRHFEFLEIENCTSRSADPENPPH